MAKIHPHLEGASDGLRRFTKAQQEIVLAALSEPTKAVLNGSDPGVGKTSFTSEIVARQPWRRVLIMGIKDTVDQWAESISDQSDGRFELRAIDSTKGGRANLQALLAGEDGIFFSGMEFIVRQDWEHRDKIDPMTGEPIPAVKKSTGEPTGKNERERVQRNVYRKMKRPLDALVVDEVHKITANRKGVGRRTLISIPTEWKIGLSGTWHGNAFENAWSPTRWLWPDLIDGSFHRWKDKWCLTSTDEVYIAGEAQEFERILGEKVPGAFAASLPCYFRIEKEPPPPAKIVYVDLTPRQRAQYSQMERDSLVWLAQRHPHLTEAQLIPLVAELPISQRQRLRTASFAEMSMSADGEVMFEDDAPSAKLQALSGLLKFYGRQKVVIYTESKRAAKVTVRRMLKAGLSVAEWSGDINAAGRDAIKSAFLTPLEAGGLQYIVAVISAFGTGLDGFQLLCNKIVWIGELEGDAVQNDQAVNRIWRQGGDLENFEHVKILARDTLDSGVFMLGQQKSVAMHATMRKAA